ncbi:MAG: hypothetical protein LW688_10320 [Cryomorphaceae bacterium]|jgi:hypothetical protein|nr:hypothetical protein [Cryomorphaceae bacterium]
MKQHLTPHWTFEEFNVYLLLYAAHADLSETEQEKEAILATCEPELYKRIHREFDDDNDYRQIEKIIVHLHEFQLTKEDVRQLLHEMKKVQSADKAPDILEKSMMMLIKRIFEQETAG